MPVTYDPIATTTLGTAGTVTFSSISQSYTDLLLVVEGTASPAVNIEMRVGNGSVDTASNYSNTYMVGTGSSALSSRETSQTVCSIGAVYTGRTINLIQLMNYSNTTTNKSFLNRMSAAGSGAAAYVGLWRNTSAINIITLTTTLGAGTVLSLYGIKAA
jgi:hypothetical protein